MSQSNPSEAVVNSGTECEWSYSGDGTLNNGPNQWGNLPHGQSAKCYPNCASIAPSQQSPINVGSFVSSPNPPVLKFNYVSTSVQVGKAHHNFQISYPQGSTSNTNTVSYNGTTYNLVGIHCHTLAEHTFNGHAYPIELHLVHQTGNPPQTLVVATFYSTTPGSSGGEIVEQITKNGESFFLNANDLIPPQSGYYTYIGSLTTPACDPNVTWLLSPNASPMDEDYFNAFKSALHNVYRWGENARPVQAQLQGTTVYWF